MKSFSFARSLGLALVATAIFSLPPAAIATSTKATLLGEPNPAAPGFLAEESDAEAIAIADRVMLRMGGRSAWDSTRFVTWRFFGNRLHVWDKHTGDIRIEGTDRETQEPYLVLMNLNSKDGRAWQSGVEITDSEALGKLLELGESAWINDAYWMFMPYKLKDTGVALKFRGAGSLLDGRPAEVVELTFREVGRTPENRYEVYVANDTGLVEQWDFYTDANDESPRFRVPWRNWRRHGSILLSDDRGRGQHSDIAVFDQLPSEVFTEPEPVDLSTQTPAESSSSEKLAEAPIYAVDGEVAKPQATHRVPPEYSESARKARITGRAVVRTVIGPDGEIRDAWITEPLEESLDQAALDAVRQWTFEPATLDDKPVSVYYNLTINFELDGDSPHQDSAGEATEGGSD